LSLHLRYPSLSFRVRILTSKIDIPSLFTKFRVLLSICKARRWARGLHILCCAFVLFYSVYGPRNLSPLKCTKWSGLSAIQTSVSQAISVINCLNFCRVKNAVT